MVVRHIGAPSRKLYSRIFIEMRDQTSNHLRKGQKTYEMGSFAASVGKKNETWVKMRVVRSPFGV